MKKVLIIGHFWPYRGGSVRMLGLAKYLPEFGWEPIVLTGPLKKQPSSNFRFIETNYLGFLGPWVKIFGLKENEDLGEELKKKFEKASGKIKSSLKIFYNLIREIFAFPDEDKNWKKFALEAAENLLKEEKINAIMSIWPVTSHLVAKELKERYKIPWLADFPDLWSQNHCYPYSLIRKYFDEKLELKTLSSADALITVSLPCAEKLKMLHKKEMILTITNGFDPEKVNNPATELTLKFTITYTGQIYPEKQDPLKIFLVLRDLISNGILDQKDIELRFYGPEQNWLTKEIEKYQLSNVVKQYGVIPREDSLKKQWESQILLLLNWEDPKEKGLFSGKVFEYLAAKRPILATGGYGNDVVETLIKETKAGVYCQKIEDIKKALTKFYLEYKQKGKISYQGEWGEIEKYSYYEMAKKFVDVLNQITEK